MTAGVLLRTFVPLFVAVDAFGLLPIFVSVTERLTPERRRSVTFQAVGTAFALAIGFLILSDAIFSFLHVSVTDFQIAGGILLLVLAVLDLLQFGKPAVDERHTVGIFPLATPLIAGPATLTTAMVLARNDGYSATLFGLALNFALLLLILLMADPVSRALGVNALAAISKLVMILLAAIAVSFIRAGVTQWIQSLPSHSTG